MSGKQRRGYSSATAPGWRRLLWSGGVVIGLASPGMITCGGADVALDNCDSPGDCQALPGTVCNGTYCTCLDKSKAYCLGACRPIGECSQLGGTGGAGGGDGACETAAECPQPGDPHCGTATCEDGACGLTLRPFSELPSQIRGDCKDLWCDGAGNVVELESTDVYNDGAQCTFDVCENGEANAKLIPTGSTCPETGAGVCYEGKCVACVDNFANCPAGYSCDGVICVPMHCVNNSWDKGSGETAYDCGGPCRPCQAGSACNVNADCLHGVCSAGACLPPTCSDEVKNDNETGIDCGGPPSCPRCPTGQGCKLGSDCESGVCWAGVCEPPKCDDGILNGDETEWDCGGSCDPCP